MNTTPADYSHLVIDRSDGEPDWDQYGPEVTKIVLGNSPTDDDAAAITISQLPDDIAERFPALTHLHLWKIESLESLPQLPPSLRCLDLRGCADLVELTDLPEELESLDVGYCPKLARLPNQAPQHLQRLHFDGCDSLTTRILENTLASLKEQAAPVVEITGSETAAVTSLREFPAAALKKLVLRGCGSLSDAANIGEFPQLEHLDLQDCVNLESLPDIPPALRYLALYGAKGLTTFMGQSVGPYDQGHKESQNVAPIFHTRRKFGGELAIMPHAKLLLLGDGRVGKTTLAKRLQWEEFSAAARRTRAGEDLRPIPNEPFTDKVQFWRWNTGLTVPSDRLDNLRARSESAGVQTPITSEGLLDGAVRLWDFGGQEQYHNTHRIFASEGSIFLIVWQDDQPDPGKAPEDLPEQEWKEWNRQHSLDYWLDYIYSMRPDADVALVCTNCPNPDDMSDQPNWRKRSQRHRKRDLSCFFVDSLDEQCGQHQEYQRLVQWIREACGKEADRIGILQPTFFRSVSDQVDDWLQSNSEARKADRLAEHLLVSWQHWRQSVGKVYEQQRRNPSIELDERDVTTITDYLHDAGHLFQIRHQEIRAVLVDQEWASDRIYKLLSPRDDFRKNVKSNGGWFFLADLESDDRWKALADDAQRHRLLAYMEECDVITRIADRHSHRLEQDVYLASDKWLLPTYEDVEAKIKNPLDAICKKPGMKPWHFELEDVVVSEFEFRSLQAHLAAFFGTRATYFRTGLQAMEADANPDWCFRIRWSPESEDAFFGKIKSTLVARHQHIDAAVRQVEELFYGNASPLANASKLIERKAIEEIDLKHEHVRVLRDDEYDLAVSSSGADRTEATKMVEALEAAGNKVNWYLLEPCRSEDRAGVLAFMNSLRRPPCIVLFVSADYLRNDPLDNWYCPWELADAIVQISEGKRTTDQTLVVFKESDTFKFASFDTIVRDLFEGMAKYFLQAYANVGVQDLGKFRNYNKVACLFSDALETTTWNAFFDERGSLGSAISYDALPQNENGETDFTSLIAAIEKAVRRKLR